VDRYAERRSLSRASLAGIWRAYKAGGRLDGEERPLAQRMTAHREWAASWEFADDLGDEELVTREGVSPFGRIAVEAAVEGLTRVATWSGGGRTTREDQLPAMERFAVDALSAPR
jgi:hypothetical protein